MNVVVLDGAIADLTDGFRFYERQQQNLGIYFLDTMWADIDSLDLYGGIHAIHFGFHRLLTKRFPFAIYYSAKDDTAYVRAVLDCRRNPAWIRNRLK